MTDFLIRVIVDPRDASKGARAVRGELQQTETAAGKLNRTLKGALAGLSVGLAVRELAELSDAYTQAQNRIRTLVDDQEELAEVTDRLFESANRTRSAYDATVETYARVGLAARELGKTDEELIQFTESLNQAVILSGASAQEASAGLIQLSQGIASGALRGDELRSVLEQLPVVADVIAKSLGVTRGELRKMGEDGKITAEVVLAAFADAREELEGRFAESVPTIGQAFTVLRNNLVQFVGEADKALGTSAALSSAIIGLAENIDDLVTVVTIGGAAFAALKLGPVVADAARLTSAFVETRVAIAQGRAVALGSAEATRQQAAAAVEAAAAEASRTAATIAGIEAERAKAVVVGQGTAAGIAQAEAELTTAAARARSAQVALTAAQAEASLATARAEAALASAAAQSEAALGTAAAETALATARAQGSAALATFQAQEAQLAIARAGAAASSEALVAAQARLATATAAATTTEASQRAVESQLAALKTTLAAQTDALAAAQARLGTATAATTVKHLLFRRAFSVNPFTLLVAGATAAYFALRELDEVLDEIQATQEQAAQGENSALSQFGKLGEQVRKVTAQVEHYRELVEADAEDGVVNQVQLELLERAEGRLAALTKEQERLRSSTEKATTEARKQREAMAALAAGFDQSREDLETERRLLSLTSSEREVQAELLQEIDRLQGKDGPQLSETQRGELEALIRRNVALREQADVLDTIRGPSEEFAHGLEALRALLSTGQIDLETFNAQVSTLASDLGGVDLGGATVTFGGVESLEEAVAVMTALTTKQRELTEAEALRAQVIEEVVGPTDELLQRQAILNELIAQGGANTALYREALAAVEAELHPLNEQQALQAELLEQIRGPQEHFAQVQEALAVLLQSGKITAEEYTAALEDAANATGQFLASTPQGKIAELEKGLGSFGDQVSGLGDEILNFAASSSQSFDDFTTGLLLDLQRILAEKALIALLDAFSGGSFSASGLGGLLFGGAKAEGGDVDPNKSYLVGEEGPEFFTPEDSGQITPAGETAAMLSQGAAAAPIVNVAPPAVNVYNVSDPKEIPQGIQSAEGEAAVLNVIRRKRRAVKGITG